MTTLSKPDQQSPDGLQAFVEGVCESDPFKVEKDFGHGYVRLRSTEAEKRQAAQDVQCVEDIVIELLRNSRDAQARSIFLATAKEGSHRSLTVIDDGCGIPHEMWDAIFEPRVTSKLESAHMDKWGMHGRGMALYSTKVNAESARVVASKIGNGCAIRVDVTDALPEKSDQSTFPRFEEADGVMAMRGPKNILRTSCEFALEHRRDVSVFVGTPAQVVSALYQHGLATLPAYKRAFDQGEDIPLIQSLGLAHGPEDLAARAASLGLDISDRTARRIMDGKGSPLEDLSTLMERSLLTKPKQSKGAVRSQRTSTPPSAHLRLSASEKEAFLSHVMDAYGDIAEAYYLEREVAPRCTIHEGKMVIEIPLASSDAPDEASGL